jgi:hypothetical protein
VTWKLLQHRMNRKSSNLQTLFLES